MRRRKCSCCVRGIYHIQNYCVHPGVVKLRRLLEDSTVSKMEIVQQEGNRQVRRKVDYYSLDAIISVGYRVNSKRVNGESGSRLRIFFFPRIKKSRTLPTLLNPMFCKQKFTRAPQRQTVSSECTHAASCLRHSPCISHSEYWNSRFCLIFYENG